jgi:hypothetical protein
MNLHGIVRGAITTVNPDVVCPYYKSTGFTQDAAFKPSPTYAAPVNVPCQIQALTARELSHEAFVNIQGLKRGVYMYGNTQGVDRSNVKGGDLLRFKQPDTGAAVQTWLVVAVFETWPDWSKVGVVLQIDKAAPT